VFGQFGGYLVDRRLAVIFGRFFVGIRLDSVLVGRYFRESEVDLLLSGLSLDPALSQRQQGAH
jgi:hypothetical protein